MDNVLIGKRILITGGTSRLGEAFVRKALRQGARVFLTYYQAEDNAKVLARAGARCYRLALESVEAIEDFAGHLKSETDRLDVLIHNAAAVRDHTILNMTEEEWDFVLKVNLKAPYYLTKKLLPLLFKRSEGPRHPLPSGCRAPSGTVKKIFLITSRTAVTGGIGISNYSASKAGLIALAKSLAQELGKKRILVNTVNPGFMRSRMTEGMPEDAVEANLAASPIRQASDPEEVADFLICLSSDRMTQVTGQVLHFESRRMP